MCGKSDDHSKPTTRARALSICHIKIASWFRLHCIFPVACISVYLCILECVGDCQWCLCAVNQPWQCNNIPPTHPLKSATIHTKKRYTNTHTSAFADRFHTSSRPQALPFKFSFRKTNSTANDRTNFSENDVAQPLLSNVMRTFAYKIFRPFTIPKW